MESDTKPKSKRNKKNRKNKQVAEVSASAEHPAEEEQEENGGGDVEEEKKEEEQEHPPASTANLLELEPQRKDTSPLPQGNNPFDSDPNLLPPHQRVEQSPGLLKSSSSILDDDTASMASFNSKFFDSYHFDPLEGGVDLQNVQMELKKREDKLRELHADRVKLKALLKKAKTAIDSIS